MVGVIRGSEEKPRTAVRSKTELNEFSILHVRDSLGLFCAYLNVAVIMEKEGRLQLLQRVEGEGYRLLEAMITKESLQAMMKRLLNAVKPSDGALLKVLLSCKQGKGENFLKYPARFKSTACDVKDWGPHLRDMFFECLQSH